jgi:hypothetical protein
VKLVRAAVGVSVDEEILKRFLVGVYNKKVEVDEGKAKL